MQKIEPLKPDNHDKFRVIYEDFRNKALKDYKYQDIPIEFDDFIAAAGDNRLGCLILLQNEEPEGILIYSPEKYGVIEINAIHSKDRPALLRAFLEHLKPCTDWSIISYAMLGKQESFIREITLQGFGLVGQSIVKFDFQDPVSYRVLRNSNTPEYSNLAFWDEKYKEQAVELVHLAFKNSKSACFDPRFLSYDGSRGVLDMVLTGQYGIFLPFQSRILLRDGNLEGFCLVVMVSEQKTNIPLIAVRKDSRNKGLGRLLLKSVIGGFVKLINERKVPVREINATVDTDNYPAIKMYRRLGFKEEYFYAHAWLGKN